MLFGLAIVTTGCQSNAFTRQGLLAPVTKQGQVIVAMWQGSWIAAWAVGIVVWGGILWAVIFHRKRGDQLPRQVRYNLPIELLVHSPAVHHGRRPVLLHRQGRELRG